MNPLNFLDSLDFMTFPSVRNIPQCGFANENKLTLAALLPNSAAKVNASYNLIFFLRIDNDSIDNSISVANAAVLEIKCH